MNTGIQDLAPNSKMALALMRDLFGLDTVTAFKEARVPVRCINSAGGYQFFTQLEVCRLRCGHPRGRRHYPRQVQPQSLGRAQGVCDQELSPVSPGTEGSRAKCEFTFRPQLHSYIPNHPDKSKDLQLSRRELAVVAIVMLGIAIMYWGLTAFQHAAIVPQIGAQL
jgi:hypothetical protein